VSGEGIESPERPAGPDSATAPDARVLGRLMHGPDGTVTWRVDRRILMRWRALAVGGLALVILLAGAVVVSMPRVLAYDALLDENLALRGRVEDLDRRMGEVDRILMRLRLYDAQLRSLGEAPIGEHGPLDQDAEPPPDDLDDGPYLEVDIEGDEFGYELRPAGAWADAVIARADSFLSVFVDVEPDLNALVEELEGLRALDEALPSQWPTSGMLTSRFGYRRSPFGRRAQFHKGIDVSNERGTPIVAAAPGRVIRALFNGGYGRMVEIDHGYGLTTRYAHLNRILVEEGDEIARGAVIGTMGRTGRVTGVHLHFEVRVDEHAVDPLDYLPR
jgi:hypothetical protein